ncbi:MAG TPA: beta-ketoacyl-[acyl-carrier-protein] synthase family protein [Pirellulales bacterium]|nr:beta-ketoacyl-[acyl-carrier-protein] synthase family protein [Pirellulales bacterium]
MGSSRRTQAVAARNHAALSVVGSDAGQREPVVITGIGLITSLGAGRESVWSAIRQGRSGVRRLDGLQGIPDGLILGAPVDVPLEFPGQLKAVAMAQHAAAEAIADSGIDLSAVDTDRFGCAISGHMGDTGFVNNQLNLQPSSPGDVPWWQQWLPNTGCSHVANRFGLNGPRMCHSTACASGLIEVLSAMRALEDDQCDVALAGSAEAFHPLFASGFRAMRVLAEHDDPQQACRPFDRGRSGFVMGEGSAMFVLERLSHAQARGARIYSELLSGKMLAEAHHVTGLDMHSDALTRLISDTLRRAELDPGEIDYISAHGTGTLQNDVAEVRGIRRALGNAADQTWLSSIKSMVGHLVNAAGSVELAITALALRDGFAPPTINLTDQDPECDMDCIPLTGRNRSLQTALKLSVAFGGHLAAVALRRWPESQADVHGRRQAIRATRAA